MDLQHAEAQGALVDGVWRGGNIDENAGAAGDQFGDRVAGVHGRGPEGFIVPDVLANGDTELFPFQAVDILLVGGLEVAGLVEDVVGGQQHLALFEDDAAAGDERGFIGDVLTAAVVGNVAGVANDGGERHLRGNLF